jgi:micrococcal nuclease
LKKVVGMKRLFGLLLILPLVVLACTEEATPSDSDNGEQNNANVPAAGYPLKPQNLTTARVTDVIDGDTLDLDDGQRIRLIGVNTPERDQPYYEEARGFLQGRVEGKQVEIEYDVERTDQYDRTLAYLWLGGVLVNQEILTQGYANSLIFPPNQRYEEFFLLAEQSAQDAGIGLWRPAEHTVNIRTIRYDAAGNDDENLNDEWIEFQNKGTEAVNLEGFTLEDAASNNYTFGAVTIAPEQILKLYSGCGADVSNALYWCSDGSIWNNNGDTAILRDTEGLYVADYQYTR